MIQLEKSYFEEITKEKIQKITELAEPYFAYRRKLYERYTRKNIITGIVGENENANIAILFEYYIVNIAQGYLSGKPPIYTVKESANTASSEKYKEAIEYIRRYNDDAATFTELIHDYLTTAAAYLYVSENENNEIVYTRFNSRNTICIYDYGAPPYPIAMININAKGETVITTDKLRRAYDSDGNSVAFDDYGDGGVIETMREKPLFWGDVPVAPFENPDNTAIFEPAIGLIGTYENIMTNAKSMTQYNDAAKLKVVGYAPENPMYNEIRDENGEVVGKKQNAARIKEEEDLYNAKALFLQSDGDVTWLLKNINYSGILSVLKQIHDLITMLTGVPNMTDEAFSNADNASALGYKLYSLNQYSAVTDRIFRKGYLRLWEIITNRLNLKHNENYDFRDIDIIFNRNIPTDADKSIQRAVTAKSGGIVSLETAVRMADIDVDAESEVNKIEKEKFNINNINTEKISDAKNN